MKGNQKKIDSFLSELDSHCAAGDIRPLLSTISQFMGTYLLKRFRERKMILRAPLKSRPDIALCLLAAAEQLEQDERDRLANYLEYSIASDRVRRQLLKEMHEKIRRMGSCCAADSLGLAYEIFDAEAARLAKYAFSGGPSEKVALEERRLHDLNGHLVDLSNALARVLNEIGRAGFINSNQPFFKRKQRKRALAAMRGMLRIAGQLNSLEWLFDEVSFGHFVVAERDSNNSAIKLDFADVKMALMRRLATRRSLILKYMDARSERYVRNELSRIQGELLDYALDYYCNIAGISSLCPEDIEKARKLGRASLVIIDAEDDLLFVASKGDKRVQAYYLAGMTLTCFAIAGQVVRDARRRTGVAMQVMAIPLTRIQNGGLFIGTESSFISEGLMALSVTLPLRSHSQLNALPFVRDGNGIVMPFLHGYTGMWNVMVRNALNQGGKLGKDVGAIWEEFQESSFKDTTWRIVGKGIKLRRGGQTVTDIDLLLLRNDLLLVVQIKALNGSADTPYDHWKNRQVVEKGCLQARRSVDFLTENADTLTSICGKRASEEIHVIQPVVLTNIHHLEGLILFDVPVIGEATRKSICRGSAVDYITSDGQKVHSHVFVAPDQLDTNEILRLLKEPVELLIAPERPETMYRVERLGGIEFSLPDFLTVSTPFQPPELETTTSLPENKVENA